MKKVSNIENLSIKQFNRLYPVGTEVKYYPIRSNPKKFVLTKTTTLAWELGSGAKVVGLEYGAGGYFFNNIEVINE